MGVGEVHRRGLKEFLEVVEGRKVVDLRGKRSILIELQ